MSWVVDAKLHSDKWKGMSTMIGQIWWLGAVKIEAITWNTKFYDANE